MILLRPASLTAEWPLPFAIDHKPLEELRTAWGGVPISAKVTTPVEVFFGEMILREHPRRGSIGS